jgi:hypothetical protein
MRLGELRNPQATQAGMLIEPTQDRPSARALRIPAQDRIGADRHVIAADRSPDVREAVRAMAIQVLNKPLEPASPRAVMSHGWWRGSLHSRLLRRSEPVAAIYWHLCLRAGPAPARHQGRAAVPQQTDPLPAARVGRVWARCGHRGSSDRADWVCPRPGECANFQARWPPSGSAGDWLMIRRLDFIARLGSAAAWPLGTYAQQPRWSNASQN